MVDLCTGMLTPVKPCMMLSKHQQLVGFCIKPMSFNDLVLVVVQPISSKVLKKELDIMGGKKVVEMVRCYMMKTNGIR